MKNALIYTIGFALITSCSSRAKLQKGFQVNNYEESPETSNINGLEKDSLKFETRPGGVLLTGIPNVRVTSIFKVNYKKDKKTTFIGSNNFITKEENYEYNPNNTNIWNNHILPGFEAVYGYNFVNISHYDMKENKQKLFFEKPVLIKTFYYPSSIKDTLNYKPVNRNYFIVSLYNDDTNKDDFINSNDLRRIYLFNINGEKQKLLVPENYSVIKSEYDSENYLMFVFAQLDSNQNGSKDENEPMHVFWIDLKDPNRTGQQYK
jgi:hypothetical protein